MSDDNEVTQDDIARAQAIINRLQFHLQTMQTQLIQAEAELEIANSKVENLTAALSEMATMTSNAQEKKSDGNDDH